MSHDLGKPQCAIDLEAAEADGLRLGDVVLWQSEPAVYRIVHRDADSAGSFVSYQQRFSMGSPWTTVKRDIEKLVIARAALIQMHRKIEGRNQ